MFRFRSDKPTEAAERLARALDVPQQDITSDDDINAQLRAARALAPNQYPREAFRATLKHHMLREVDRPALPDADGGSRDGRYTPTHRAEVVNPDLGRVVLADVEAIDGDRAEFATRELTRVLHELQEQEQRYPRP